MQVLLFLFIIIISVEGITIATDIICGFPTETEDNFDETLALLTRYKFPVLFINQFYPRPGTPAAKMKRVPTQEVSFTWFSFSFMTKFVFV